MMEANRRFSFVSNDPSEEQHQQEFGDENDHDDGPPSAKSRKPPHTRSRASRACDRCKARKTRCSGKYPCALCSRLHLECEYTASYRRGRLPSIEMDDTGDHSLHAGQGPQSSTEAMSGRRASRRTDPGESQPAEHIPSPVSTESRPLAPPQGASATQSSRTSPEPAQTDRQGHYVGPASGASFLLRIQRKLQLQPTASSSATSIFTFGDLPLPVFDPRFLILPPRSEAEILLSRYFEFASATHRFLHRPTVERWLQEMYETQGSMRDQSSARSRTALLFMVFAQASNYPKSKAGAIDPTTSARFFSAAEEQLSAETGAIRLTSVQARLAQCFYLLSHSRLNHCWSLFGTSAHLMLALGIHRRSRADPNTQADYVDLECRKRTFWCAYNLDTYLSAALGRPRTFHDDDIDQEMPLCVDDYILDRGQPIPAPTPGLLSVMSGPVAHIKLSRIVANILRDLYGIRPPSLTSQYNLAAKYAEQIESWRNSVSFLADTDRIDPSLFQPIFLRQRNVLHMACWHAQLLIHRPFLLNNFASLANLGSSRQNKPSHRPDQSDDHVRRCMEAALKIVGLVDDLSSRGQLYNTFWFSHYFAFCAVVILYLFALQQRHAPVDSYLPAFHAATRCQTQITSIAIPGSLAQRYGLVLQELRLELLRHNSHLLSLATESRVEAAATNQRTLTTDDAAAVNQFHADLLAVEADLAFPTGAVNGQLPAGDDRMGFPDMSPGSSIAQLTGWGQFDSLVIGGGIMDTFLGQGNMEGWNMTLGGDGMGDHQV